MGTASKAEPLRALVVVAHPDDETLWAGGLMLANPQTDWFVLSLCRRGDPDRAPRFKNALRVLNADGAMGDLDDCPEQVALDERLVEQAVLAGLPERAFDLILTHGEKGEYTFHRRHIETSQAVTRLWQRGTLRAPRLWQFAYQDEGRQTLPRAIASADLFLPLPDPVWQAKYRLVSEVYGFNAASWEARVTPREEAFWMLSGVQDGETHL